MISMLPLAAGDGWVPIVVVVVIMIVSAISQAMGNKKKEEPPRPRPRPRPPVRPAQAGQQQNPGANELDEFLRRAAGGGQPARRQPPPVRPVVAQPVMAEATDELEVIESVVDHMSHSADDSRFEQPQQQNDEVSQKFDQQIGQLGSTSTQAAHAAAIADDEAPAQEVLETMPSTGAAGLAAMLASPASLRQAILLSEILKRPEQRWN